MKKLPATTVICLSLYLSTNISIVSLNTFGSSSSVVMSWNITPLNRNPSKLWENSNFWSEKRSEKSNRDLTRLWKVGNDADRGGDPRDAVILLLVDGSHGQDRDPQSDSRLLRIIQEKATARRRRRERGKRDEATATGVLKWKCREQIHACSSSKDFWGLYWSPNY